MIKSVYVAATSQHVGKTTCTLGLVAALRQHGARVGYCKPVGQEFMDLGDLRVDKDALLFSQIMNFDLSAEIHSPVILGHGATTAYLDDPKSFDYRGRILNASRHLQDEYESVVYEGTGHPGVGSVVDLSNADVAHLVNAGVIIIVEGGIGNTIDRLSLCLSKFRERDVPILGVIINKTLPEKMDKVEHYIGRWLNQKNLALLGVLPYDKSLSNPIMATILDAVQGRVLANEDRLDNRVEDFISGSLIGTEDLSEKQNLLLVVSHKRLSEAMDKIKQTADLTNESSPISGVIVTGDGRHIMPVEHSPNFDEYIERYRIPVLTTALDTLGSVVKISRIEVKINTRTPWKAVRAIELIKKHVNLNAILESSLLR
ncbi:MAG: AAA family ATPase [Saprospiraceae bacterium]|nr:AAA family ATPase [Saprospiraceae bacterium]